MQDVWRQIIDLFGRRSALTRSLKAAVAVLVVACASGAALAADATSARRLDDVVLISSRRVGTQCRVEAMAAGLDCRAYAVTGSQGERSWQAADLDSALPRRSDRPTIVYVHGNRVEPAEAFAHGLRVYRSLQPRLPADTPVRFVIWSWPADQIRGVRKDYAVKAARTGPVAWQVAWALNRLAPDAPLALIGYSYGARVTTGTLHLLAGGTLEGRATPELQPRRTKAHAILLAAAVDADWLRPGGHHGRALEQVDHLTLVTNRRDPAMRFYHLSTPRDVRALGYAGPTAVASLQQRFRVEIDAFDATSDVGRHHALQVYLASSPQLVRAWQSLASLAPASHGDSPQTQMVRRENMARENHGG